jgi:4-hydroxythreonine-4-phosphate dehydrogenase
MSLRIAVTTGEPAGIGPEILLQLCQQQTSQQQRNMQLVAVADQQLLAQRAQLLQLPITLEPVPEHRQPAPAGTLYVKHVPLATSSQAGQ